MNARPLPHPKRVAFGALLCGLIVVATLGLFELALQVAAFFVGPRALAASAPGGEEIILCLGDSNTYGVFYPQEKAYPAQLQTILDRRAPGRYKTLNLGLPGMNSSQVATRLEDWIDRYHPRIAVVSVGVNNYWNLADTAARRAGGARLLDRSRLFRLVRLLVTEATRVPADTGRPEIEWILPDGGVTHNLTLDADTGEVLIEHRGNWKVWNRGDSEVAAELYADLSSMAELTARRGVALFVMTYAASPLPGREPRFSREQKVNETMRRFSREHGVALVDLQGRFQELLPPEQPRSLLFASERESHANPVGYREVAVLAADAIHPAAGVKGTLAPGATDARRGVYFFLDHFEEAVVERQQVDYEQVDRRRIRIGDDERRALFQHPTTAVAFPEVAIGEGAILEFAIATHQDAWDKPGDGVVFIVDVVDQEGQRAERYSRYLDPKHWPNVRRWLDERLDLGDLAGQKVSFVFRTQPGPEENSFFDWSVWGEPRLVAETAQ
ncbi:MAG: GDSL-type esterase/lipase family protein [Acidobacteriota bacterium]|nr:GDSL-type esterase/lipase family protein [Acidobacteriota bacterium]MDH3524294.1 GDSL-type esterase/lipase family protein [Acidobacteriota bacterium]